MSSIFPGFNDRGGIMVCGLERGKSKSGGNVKVNLEAKYTFSNPCPKFGAVARTWQFQNRIIKWFSLWGHPLTRNHPDNATDFDRCIVHANWCNTQNHKFCDDGGYSKAKRPKQIENFIDQVARRKPKLIIFFGIKLFDILQEKPIMEQFQRSGEMGKCIRKFIRKEGRFRVGFQEFENGNVVAFPHPSWNWSHATIKIFRPEMDALFRKFKREKGLPS